MILEIITPDKTLFKGEARLVQLPGADGSFEILNNHAPIISTLRSGLVKVITNEGNTERIDIKSGVLEMNNNKAIILAEQA
jgi:F-type H+-transporting ATPase subunit epsilon